MDIIKGEITKMIKSDVYEIKIEHLDVRNDLIYAEREIIVLGEEAMEAVKEQMLYGYIRQIICACVLCFVKKRKKNGQLEVERLMVIKSIAFEKEIIKYLTR